ncbi:MAG: NADPH-dependent FMN reductase [Steroidobacter sp.]
MIKLLALCGSLRRASLNAILLRATQRITPDEITIEIYPTLGNLPLFNPDLESSLPAPVVDLRDSIIQADGLIIASPEYARGISGVMKNALDWMVGNESFVYKPVMLLNTSPRAYHALDALRLTLQTMSAVVVDEAHVAVQIMGTRLDEDGIVNGVEISESLRSALRIFAISIVDVQHKSHVSN